MLCAGLRLQCRRGVIRRLGEIRCCFEAEGRQEKEIFKNKTLLITGGTGSFGNAIIKRFLNTGIKEIRIFSRDEKSRMICGMF